MAAPDEQQIPGWPLLDIRLTPDGGAAVDGTAVAVSPGTDARTAALLHAAETAARVGRPVRARLTEQDGAEGLIAVHSDAGSTVLEDPTTTARKGRKRRTKPPAQQTAVPEAQQRVAPQAVPPSLQRPSAPPSKTPTPVRPEDTAQERLRAAVERQDWAEALALCEQGLREAPGEEVDRLRGVQAGLTARSGDTETAYLLFKALAQDRADRHGPDDSQAVVAAEAAQQQWAVLPAGDAADLLELRSRVPGPGGEGLTRARKLVVRSRLR
ncbi:hypothetical protein [Streptomyces sp. WMMC940]|uniref:hypothetical protein n=1 Tax=Streptomyces sp. WMMC940 TaxID=3015153 RepID=UPI0022B6A860|nr:hypothetical protein [Streptomyces sp. WMMC940]MCZ7458211.1 hypothetical protein [Streptomyces sp. WMMC940]